MLRGLGRLTATNWVPLAVYNFMYHVPSMERCTVLCAVPEPEESMVIPVVTDPVLIVLFVSNGAVPDDNGFWFPLDDATL